MCESHIAFGAPNKQDTAAAHGEPLGEGEIKLTKKNYGWPEDEKFFVPEGRAGKFRNGFSASAAARLRDAWTAKFAEYKSKYPELAEQLTTMQRRELPAGWDKDIDRVSRRSKRPSDARFFRQSSQRHRQKRSLADGRLGGSGAVDQDATDV